MIGCNSEKKAIRLADKSWSTNHSGFAKQANLYVPCVVEEVKRDTVLNTVTKKDTVSVPQYVTVDCPTVDDKGDTVYIPTKVKAPCNCVNTNTYTDHYINTTVKIRNTRDSTIQAGVIQTLQKRTDRLVSARNTFIGVSVVLFLCLTALILIIVFKPKFL